MNNYNEIDYVFFLRSLPKQICNEIEDSLSDMKFKIIKVSNKINHYNIEFRLEECNFNIYVIKNIIEKYNLAESDYDYCCRIGSEYNNQSIYMPNDIMDYYRETGGGFSFSY